MQAVHQVYRNGGFTYIYMYVYIPTILNIVFFFFFFNLTPGLMVLVVLDGLFSCQPLP